MLLSSSVGTSLVLVVQRAASRSVGLIWSIPALILLILVIIWKATAFMKQINTVGGL